MIFYDIKTMYRFEPKCNLLRSTLQAKQQVSEAVVCRVLKILKTPQENICVWVYWTATLLKGDLNTGVFLWNLQNLRKHLFL